MFATPSTEGFFYGESRESKPIGRSNFNLTPAAIVRHDQSSLSTARGHPLFASKVPSQIPLGDSSLGTSTGAGSWLPVGQYQDESNVFPPPNIQFAGRSAVQRNPYALLPVLGRNNPRGIFSRPNEEMPANIDIQKQGDPIDDFVVDHGQHEGPPLEAEGIEQFQRPKQLVVRTGQPPSHDLHPPDLGMNAPAPRGLAQFRQKRKQHQDHESHPPENHSEGTPNTLLGVTQNTFAANNKRKVSASSGIDVPQANESKTRKKRSTTKQRDGDQKVQSVASTMVFKTWKKSDSLPERPSTTPGRYAALEKERRPEVQKGRILQTEKENHRTVLKDKSPGRAAPLIRLFNEGVEVDFFNRPLSRPGSPNGDGSDGPLHQSPDSQSLSDSDLLGESTLWGSKKKRE